MIVKGVVLREDKKVVNGRNGQMTIRTVKVRENLKNGDEKHVYVKIFGDNGYKTEIGKPVEIEFMDRKNSYTGKDGKFHENMEKIAVV